ncbi:hypothetical protein [Bacillus sp. FJAT-27264]|uniref:hypothetical protein n=1 Tax=Paenibacillus sp. (strain DSM 101736 / FJAT-27264) TaxID=1850362 RepID=UPI001112149A|nr:hypothetical protein [Bacillus sp. FJAT-27264]
MDSEQIHALINSLDALIVTATEAISTAEKQGAIWLIQESEKTISMAQSEKNRYISKLHDMNS